RARVPRSASADSRKAADYHRSMPVRAIVFDFNGTLSDDEPLLYAVYAELFRERIDRYVVRARDGSTIDDDARAAVRYAAERVPVGIVSAATRREIEPVLEAAGVAREVAAVVSSEDVANGKPHPEPYERIASLLDLPAADVVAFEDTEAGVASAKAAGLQVVGVTRTLGAERLRSADALVDKVDLDAVRQCLS